MTWGYHKWGSKQRPYTTRLSELLSAKGVAHEIDNFGVNGDTVAEMFQRLVDEILPAAKTRPYTHAIVFGGTNDLAVNPPEVIFSTLQTILTTLSQHHCASFIVNIPQPGWEEKKHLPFIGTRSAVNALIKQHYAPQLIDLDAQLPRLSMNAEDKKLYFDDQLHYTAAGYDKLADIFFEKVYPALASKH